MQYLTLQELNQRLQQAGEAPVNPNTNFEQGGWYGGAQYWDGKFGMPGVIINPNQQGYGQLVSSEVNRQSSIAQGKQPSAIDDYLARLRQKLGTANSQLEQLASGQTTATDTGDGGSALSEYQNQLSEIDAKIAKKNQELIEAENKINENPFLSEATRVGRVRKLYEMSQKEISNLLTQRNQLWQEMQFAYQQQKDAQEAAKPNTQVIQSTDENGNLTLITIDKNTGEVISKQSIAGVGKKSHTGEVKPGSSAWKQTNMAAVTRYLYANRNSYGHVSPEVWHKALEAWLEDGLGTVREFIANYGNLTDPNRGDFAENSGYGFDKELRNVKVQFMLSNNNSQPQFEGK